MVGPSVARAVRSRGPQEGRAPGFEAVAGQQDRVGEEPGQLVQVGRAAVCQVGVGLGGDPDRHGGGGHQLGVGCLFTGEDDNRPAGGEDLVEPLLPGTDTAEEAYDDEVGAVEESREVVERQARGIGVAVGHRTVRGAGAEQVGVGRRQEQDHAASGLPRGVHAPGGVGMEFSLLERDRDLGEGSS